MKNKILWMAAILTTGMAFGTIGCELEESCDPATDPECEVSDAGDTGGGGQDTNEDTGGGQFQTYNYVLIVDEEDPDLSSPTSTAGVDIYGVQLVRSAGGATFNASQVHACNFGSGDNDRATDCNQALGAPDSTCSPSSNSPTYVSLGGNDGGELIVSFGNLEEIVQGDQVIVYECGTAENPGATQEDYDFFVGVSTDPNASTWIECANDVTGTSTCTVPSLPQIPRN